MIDNYNKNGFFILRKYFDENELNALRDDILAYHQSWKGLNKKAYLNGVINCAYLTKRGAMNDSARLRLLRFIASNKVVSITSALFKRSPAFMNTQLFFDPINTDQANYWHRDPQYHLSLAEQKEALSGAQVIHVRIPLFDEPGVELVPQSHFRWDTEEELAVRCQTGGHKNNESLETGVTVELGAGDVLVFSANMIHRGLYGKDRLALDILFCEPDPGLLSFIDSECLPSVEMLSQFDHPELFGEYSKSDGP
ncbi:MAG: phytanoyl-CoA dioxygenase family protein [Bermanella sp.]